jgi:hypothetical protein
MRRRENGGRREENNLGENGKRKQIRRRNGNIRTMIKRKCRLIPGVLVL